MNDNHLIANETFGYERIRESTYLYICLIFFFIGELIEAYLIHLRSSFIT